MNFQTLADTLCRQQDRDTPLSIPILCFDPGHTTGWAAFMDHTMVACGQIDTTSVEVATKNLMELFTEYDPNMIVMEDYRVYKWRAAHHAGSDLLTARVIGSIETICAMNGLRWVKQPAHVAKGFCTNKKLKEWGFYQTAKKHANDAIRHACYYLLFGKIVKTRSTAGKHTVG